MKWENLENKPEYMFHSCKQNMQVNESNLKNTLKLFPYILQQL